MKLFIDGECIAEFVSFTNAEMARAFRLRPEDLVEDFRSYPAAKVAVGLLSPRAEGIEITGTIHIPDDPEVRKEWEKIHEAWRDLRADHAWEFDDIRQMLAQIRCPVVLPPCGWPRDFWGTP